MGRFIFRLAVGVTILFIITLTVPLVVMLGTAPGTPSPQLGATVPYILGTASVAGTLVVALIVMAPKLQRWLMRKAEARVFRQPEPTNIASNRFNSQFMIMPIAFVVQLVQMVVSIYVIISLDSDLQLLYQLIVIICSFTVLIWALSMHFRPNSNRKTKYELLIIWFLLIKTLACFDRVKHTAPTPPHAYNAEIPALSMIISTMLLLIGGYMVLWAIYRITRDPASMRSTRVLSVYRALLVMGPLLCGTVFFVNVTTLSVLYLLARYSLFEIMSTQPIIYFRSFRHAATPTAFGDIVLRTASWYGIVIALADDTQPPSTLASRAETTNFPHLFVVSNANWRDWVIARLRSCSAVILDQSHNSVSLEWERQRAMEFVPVSRIAILSQDLAIPADHAEHADQAMGAFTMRYGLEKREQRAARKTLKAWFERHYYC